MEALRGLPRHPRTSHRAPARHNTRDTPEDPDAANAASDGGWRTFERWLGGWSQHPDDGKSPTGADAAALYARVFPAEDAMRFITWRPRKQWVAMQGRMAILAEPTSREVLTGLGGARLHEALVETHEAFGRAYGFTRAQADAAAPTADVRSAFMAAKDALRQYATRVEGNADPDVPGARPSRCGSSRRSTRWWRSLLRRR